MRWIDLQHNLDPNYRIQSEKQHLQRCIAQAQLEQSERHHNERTRIEHMRLDAQAENEREHSRAIIEREHISGKNALALADRNHILGQLQQGSQLIDSMILSQLKQEEDWNATVADTMRQLFVTEADTIRQTKLKDLDHKHQIEKMTLEFNLRTVEMYVQNEIQNGVTTENGL